MIMDITVLNIDTQKITDLRVELSGYSTDDSKPDIIQIEDEFFNRDDEWPGVVNGYIKASGIVKARIV